MLRPPLRTNRAIDRRRRDRRSHLRIESLEHRRVLAATIFQVSHTDDAGSGSLREAIEAANENPGADTIVFQRGVRGVIELDPDKGQLSITDDLTIRGPGAERLTVSGGDQTRVFAVLPEGLSAAPLQPPTLEDLAAAPTVTISGLGIEGGVATDAVGFDPESPTNPGFAFGGGLFNAGGEVHLRRVAMKNNSAVGVVTAGGAVANEFGGTLTITHSEFHNNDSTGLLIAVGGAVTSDLGPAIDTEAGELTTTEPPNVSITKSTFTNNNATAALGYIDGQGFSGLGGGGAILNVTGTMSISHSHFDDNVAQGGNATDQSTSGGPGFGGAILTGNASPFGLSQSSLSVQHSTFRGNVAIGGDGSGGNVNGGQADGGAVAVGNGGDAKLTRNRFSLNRAAGGEGGENASGGIGTGGGVAGSGGATLALAGNRFSANVAEGGGGGESAAAGRGGGLGLAGIELAGFAPGPATAELVGDRFNGNTSSVGGGIFNDGTLTLRRATLSGNIAQGQADELIEFYPGYIFRGAALGGGISNTGVLEMESTRIINNQALGADEAVGPNVLESPPGTAVPFYPGVAVGAGLHNLNEATVSRSSIVGNEAIGGNENTGSFAGVANGGGIYNDSSLVLRHSRVIDNLVQGGDANTGDINIGGGYGGGIASGTVTALAPNGRNSDLQVTRSLVSRNESRGGNDNQGFPELPPAHIAGGATAGGILVYQGTASIDRSSVFSNQAVGGKGSSAFGGGILVFAFVGSVEAEITNTLIKHNSARGESAGSAYGGGLTAGSFGSLFGTTADVTLNRSSVFGNLAAGGDDGGDGLGGGIYLDEFATAELVRSLVFRNKALGGSDGDGIGGGLYNLGEVDVVRSAIFANYASTSDDNRLDGSLQMI